MKINSVQFAKKLTKARQIAERSSIASMDQPEWVRVMVDRYRGVKINGRG